MDCGTLISEIIIIFEGASQIYEGLRPPPKPPPNCDYANYNTQK